MGRAATGRGGSCPLRRNRSRSAPSFLIPRWGAGDADDNLASRAFSVSRLVHRAVRSGKSTIAYEVYDRLLGTGVKAEYLDGDIIRGILPATGYSRREREEHVRRVGFLASRLEHHGVFVICALISPYTESRACARQLCRRFLEIHVATPLDECERRDVKGLYRRARRGEIAGFTGIYDAYEEPGNPELRIDTRDITVEQAADLVMSVIESPATLDIIRPIDEGLSLQEF